MIFRVRYQIEVVQGATKKAKDAREAAVAWRLTNRIESVPLIRAVNSYGVPSSSDG
jgi:hypothetical protein